MLRAVLEETDMAIAEIKREAYEFKRDIVIGSENTKTGKVIAERLLKYMEEKLKTKDTIVNKFNMRNQQLKLHINRANA
jgi:chromosome segregation ATPase